MKTINVLAVAVAMSLLVGCGGSETTDAPKIRADQLVFTNSQAGLALAGKNAETGCLDTETKFLASNVELNTAALGISSGNVQDAFGEVAPDINQVVMQKWEIIDLNYGGKNAQPITEGTITMNDDGTLLLEGVSENNSFSFLNNLDNKTYEIIEDAILILKTSGIKDGEPISYANVFPIVKLTPTKIVTTHFILNAILPPN